MLMGINLKVGEVMIRKYKDNDIESIMQIWKEENISVHSFIPKAKSIRNK